MELQAACSSQNISTIVLADPHLIMRHLLKTSLEATKAYNVVGEADTPSKVVQVVKELKPHVLILDLDLCGAKPIIDITSQGLPTKIVTITGQSDAVVASHALDAGASACLCKNSSWSDLLEAISKAQQGQRVISPTLTSLLEKTIQPKRKRRRASSIGIHPALNCLSTREREVFNYLADGVANRFIAKQLGVSPRTIETHRARILRKMELKSSSDIVKYAIKHNIVAN